MWKFKDMISVIMSQCMKMKCLSPDCHFLLCWFSASPPECCQPCKTASLKSQLPCSGQSRTSESLRPASNSTYFSQLWCMNYDDSIDHKIFQILFSWPLIFLQFGEFLKAVYQTNMLSYFIKPPVCQLSLLDGGAIDVLLPNIFCVSLRFRRTVTLQQKTGNHFQEWGF